MTGKTQAKATTQDNHPGDTEFDDPTWRKHKYPGFKTEAFQITNDWAKAMLAWQERVRTMCAIMQVKFNITELEFAYVLDAVHTGHHSPAEIKQALAKAKKEEKKGDFSLPSDVVGTPPDPPFADPVT